MKKLMIVLLFVLVFAFVVACAAPAPQPATPAVMQLTAPVPQPTANPTPSLPTNFDDYTVAIVEKYRMGILYTTSIDNMIYPNTIDGSIILRPVGIPWPGVFSSMKYFREYPIGTRYLKYIAVKSKVPFMIQDPQCYFQSYDDPNDEWVAQECDWIVDSRIGLAFLHMKKIKMLNDVLLEELWGEWPYLEEAWYNEKDLGNLSSDPMPVFPSGRPKVY